MQDFLFDPDQAHKMLDQFRSHDAVVLDFRGNPGGREEFLLRLVGGMFDHDVKIADRLGRKPLYAAIAKSRGPKTFAG